jgi:hypothetical protein
MYFISDPKLFVLSVYTEQTCFQSQTTVQRRLQVITADFRADLSLNYSQHTRLQLITPTDSKEACIPHIYVIWTSQLFRRTIHAGVDPEVLKGQGNLLSVTRSRQFAFSYDLSIVQSSGSDDINAETPNTCTVRVVSTLVVLVHCRHWNLLT